jgi:hypothetical protein
MKRLFILAVSPRLLKRLALPTQICELGCEFLQFGSCGEPTTLPPALRLSIYLCWSAQRKDTRAGISLILPMNDASAGACLFLELTG